MIAASNSTVGKLPTSSPSDSNDAVRKPWMSKGRKWAIALLGLVGVIAVASVVGYRWSRPARSAFRTVQVVRADITERISATGTLQPVITTPVGAQVSGIVWKLHADYNSPVKAGELLVELDPALFQNAVALATAQLAQARANLKGQSSQGQDQDDLVVMPWVTLKSRMKSQDRMHVGSILVSALSPDEVSHAQTQVTGILRQQHRLADGQLDDFTVRNLADLAATQENAADAQTGMLRNVAAVSLLVGGIGIMNIMLVSVTERTREIGIRLAIGASENKVLLQFLVEGVVLSAAGGLIGIALGFGGSLALASAMGWPFVLTPLWILVAFGISMAIGVIFGFYPARKAARMDPIDALRFE